MFNFSTLKTLYHSFIQSNLIFCSTVWGTGSKNSLKKIFIAQKKAVRALTFTDLYKKDKTTQLYSYGHTKQHFNSNDVLTIHNLILAQVLSHQHKIYILRAPTHTQSLFTPHVPPLQYYSSHIQSTHNIDNNKLLNAGINTNNIICSNETKLVYFTVPFYRLRSQRDTLTYLGPLAYNYFCNKIQLNLNLLPTIYNIHKLSPKCFNSHIKKMLLSHQSSGMTDTWELDNMPMYAIPTSNILLRSQN